MSTEATPSSYTTAAPKSSDKTAAGLRPVVVVGGGLAGLAAATALSQHGVPVTLLESRPRLGGRASSVVDAATGMLIDTCQHVAMGCCTNFLRLCEMLDVSRFFRTERRLHFVGPKGTITPFEASAWPAPLHLVGSLLKLPYLTHADKLRLASGIRRLARLSEHNADDISFADWLRANGQPDNVIRRFWDVVLVSALSESSDRISTKYARQVIVEAFLRHRHGWEVHLPVEPLSVIYDEMVRKLQSRGVTIRTQAGVDRIEVENGRATHVVLRDGEKIRGDDCILAVSFDRAGDLLPAELADHPAMIGLHALEPAPISSVHLWLDRPICDLPHAVIVDRFSQWMFNRTMIHTSSPPNDESSHYYQVVISASRNVVELDAQDAIGRVFKDLGEIWPAARSAQVLRSRLMTDHRAVFSPLPGIDRLRPPQQTPIVNLQLAGDWTQTGWPATMESAVRSGFLAAENVLRRRGIAAEPLVVSDLPTARLGKWLLGL